MKLYLTLITTALILAFATGYFALSIKDSVHATEEDKARILELKQKFEQHFRPVTVMDLNLIYYSRDHLQLIGPVYTVPSGPVLQDKDLYSTSDSCFKNFSYLLSSLASSKVVMWEEFRCGLRESLPYNFFQRSPFIHPSGRSYALLAYLSKRTPFNTRSWVRENLSFFHVTEFGRIKNILGQMGDFFKFFESLKEESLQSISAGKKFIITRKFFLTRIIDPLNGTKLKYRIYDRDEFEGFLSSTDFRIGDYKPGTTCFYRDGEGCWQYNVAHLFALANKTTVIIFIASSLVLGAVVTLLINKIKSQRLEDQRRRLALQVLTHEFRTPIASMLIGVDHILQDLSKFPEDQQEVLLRMANDVFRLQRLTETSRNYLKIQNNNKLIDLKYEKIDSVNEFFTMLLDEYVDKVSFRALDKDITFYGDRFWMALSLKNFVENALAHGEPPIEVWLEARNNCLLIHVKDHGHCQFHHIEDMCKEFVKGSQSQGTGLGLNIVYKAAKEMGGKLSLKNNPTTFSLLIPNKGGNA